MEQLQVNRNRLRRPLSMYRLVCIFSPAGPVVSELLFSPFLAFHLLALNLASVGPLLCIWLRRRGASDATDGAIRDRVGQRLAWMSLGGLVAGSLAGVVPMLQSGSEFYASLSRFPARTYWSAGGELLFALVCLWAYAAMWRRLADRPVWHGTLAVLGTTTLLYPFPAADGRAGQAGRQSSMGG